MSERFLAYIPLSEPEFVTADALVSRVNAMFPNVPMNVRPYVPEGETPAMGVAFYLSIDEVLLTVMLIDQPLPREAYETTMALDRIWPEAKNAMAEQKAHLILSNLSDIATHEQALETAAAITFVGAALISMLPTLAVVWTNGETIIAPQRFLEAADTIAKPGIPVDVWIGMRWFDAEPGPDGKRQIAVQTSGLRYFVGREIEWMPSALPAATIFDRITGACHYLIAAGPVIEDGETLGISEAEHIRVRQAVRGQMAGIPVMQLTVERLAASPPGGSSPLPGLGGRPVSAPG